MTKQPLKTDEACIEFLNEMVEAETDLDTALMDSGHILEDSPLLDTAYSDWRDARLAIRKTLRRVARENDMTTAEEMLL